MQEFIREWGSTILSALAILILIAIIVFLKPTMQSAFQSTFSNFTTQMNENSNLETETN